MSDIIARINAACVGHPQARIPWPHRLLHDAVDEITQLRAALTAVTEATTLLEAARIAREAITSADPRMPRSQTPHPPQPAPDRPGCGG